MEYRYNTKLLLQINHMRRWQVEKRMGPDSEIHYGQLPFLNYIIEHEGCKQKEVSDYFATSRAAVTKSIKRMISSGLVIRKVNSADERQYQLFASDKGIQLSHLCTKAFNEVDKIAYKGFSQQEAEQFQAFLEKIKSNLQSDYCRGKTETQENQEENK